MHQVTAALLQISVVSYYELRQIYYKLLQNIITNYDSVLLQITVALLKITAKCYYKLRQLYYKYDNVLLQITAVLSNYYKLR